MTAKVEGAAHFRVERHFVQARCVQFFSLCAQARRPTKSDHAGGRGVTAVHRSRDAGTNPLEKHVESGAEIPDPQLGPGESRREVVSGGNRGLQQNGASLRLR